jgi:hypothetical protein
MKHLRQVLWFNTPHRRDYLNITTQVQELVSQSRVADGLGGYGSLPNRGYTLTLDHSDIESLGKSGSMSP